MGSEFRGVYDPSEQLFLLACFAVCMSRLQGNGTKIHLFLRKFPAFAVLGANTQSAPIVTAHLAEIAILARMLF